MVSRSSGLACQPRGQEWRGQGVALNSLRKENQMSEGNVEMPVEEEVQEQGEESAEEPVEGEATTLNVADELQHLGRNLAAATREAMESPEAQEFGSQLQRGLSSLEKSVHQVANQARDTKVGQKVETGVSEASTSVKERGLLESLAESVAHALHTVNQSLEQAVDKAHTRAEEAKAEKVGPQPIEVVEAEEDSAEPEASEE
jgi:hypothetical protein